MAWHGIYGKYIVIFFVQLILPAALTVPNSSDVNNATVKTQSACENTTLTMSCSEGTLIDVIRANYGRYSLTVCNHQGYTNFSVDCVTSNTSVLLKERCNGHRNCSALASDQNFANSCPDTLKYLEVQYKCVSELLFLATMTTTTNRPSPPWLTPSQSSLWNTAKPLSTRQPSIAFNIPTFSSTLSSRFFPFTTTTTTITASLQSVASLIVTPPTSPHTVVKNNIHRIQHTNEPQLIFDSSSEIVNFPSTFTHKSIINNKSLLTDIDDEEDDEEDDDTLVVYPDVRQPSEPPSSSNQNTSYCPSEEYRGIWWNAILVNSKAVENCPNNSSGYAKRLCVPGENGAPARWQSEPPDLSMCNSLWLTRFEPINDIPITRFMTELSQVINSSSNFYGGDLKKITGIMRNVIVNLSHSDLPSGNPQLQAMANDSMTSVVNVVSSLFDKKHMGSWLDLTSSNECNRVATSYLIRLEEIGFLMANACNIEKTMDFHSDNIELSVSVIKTFTAEQQATKVWTANNDSVKLSTKALLNNSDGSLIRLVFTSINSFPITDEIFDVNCFQRNNFNQDNKGVDDNDNSGTDNNRNKKHRNNLNIDSISGRIMITRIMSVSLGSGKHIQLGEPVVFCLSHILSMLDVVTNPMCSYWNYENSTWMMDGCVLIATNATHTVCQCYHLTHFAVLIDVHNVTLPIPHQIALQIITYIGCVISVICLVLSVLTFQLFRGLKADRTTIHCNLCTCLLIAETVFLLGIDQTTNRVLCGIIAGLLHFFFLCAFMWMFLEGFQLYVLLIEIFEVEKSRMKWYYMFAYGLPLIIVIISLSVLPNGYGSTQYCWLQTDNYLIYSFVGPVIVILVLNLVFLSMAVVMIYRHTNPTVTLKNKEHSRLASTRVWLKSSIVLVFLLGLTWAFGFLYIDRNSVTMAYLFAILNSLQGSFIFCFLCVKNDKVRKEYRRFLRRHSWLAKCSWCLKPFSGGGSGSGGMGGITTTSSGGGSAAALHHKDRITSAYSQSYLLRSSGGCGGGSTATESSTTGGMPPPPMAQQLPPPLMAATADNSLLSTAAHDTSNTSSKSYSRDSGHGGSELDDGCCGTGGGGGGGGCVGGGLNSLTIIPDVRLNHTKDVIVRHQQPLQLQHHRQNGGGDLEIGLSPPASNNNLIYEDGGGSSGISQPFSYIEPNRYRHDLHTTYYAKHNFGGGASNCNSSSNSRPKSSNNSGGSGGYLRPNHGGHWSQQQQQHTYTEICDGSGTGRSTSRYDEDPVYEEIERSSGGDGSGVDILMSDMSDEDGRRQSDMSRQSSRSYGDHRPLIPYSPGGEHSVVAFKAINHRYAPPPPSLHPLDLDHQYRIRYRSNLNNGGVTTENARSLAAVLDGDTVVCHLEPPENNFHLHHHYLHPYHHHHHRTNNNDTYTSRTLVLSTPYNGES